MSKTDELIEKITKRTFSLSLKIIYIHRDVLMNYQESILSTKLLENGTSIGEYLVDAKSTSKNKQDYTFYLLKAQQAIARTKYWLGLLHDSSFVPSDSYDALLKELEDISRLIIKYESEKIYER